MFLGKGFDTDGDGDNDFYVVGKVNPSDVQAAVQVILAVVALLGVAWAVMALCYGVLEVWRWIIANWTTIVSVLLASVLGLVAIAAIALIVAGHSYETRQRNSLIAQSGDKKPKALMPGRTAPCRKCKSVIPLGCLRCPDCKHQWPLET